jgi:hypothetical protein
MSRSAATHGQRPLSPRGELPFPPLGDGKQLEAVVTPVTLQRQGEGLFATRL